MNLIQAIVLATIQGLTEFLPVSSSGHLALTQHLFGWEVPVSFDVLVHLGTLLAIIWYFRARLVELWQKRELDSTKRYLFLILIGSLPAVFGGLFLEPYLEVFFHSLILVGVGLLITSLLLFLARPRQKLSQLDGQAKARSEKLGWFGALKIGFFQLMALVPGVSRAGSTISGGLLVGLTRQKAFEFSFFLALPATLGAVVLRIGDFLTSGPGWGVGLVGLIVSALVGFMSLGWLEKVLAKGRLVVFSGYCLLISLLAFALSFVAL